MPTISSTLTTILIAALCGSLVTFVLYILFASVAFHARILAALNNLFASIVDHFARQHTH